MYPADNLPAITPLESADRKLLLHTGDFILMISGSIGSLWCWTEVTQSEFSWELLAYQLPWIVLMAIGWLVWLFVSDLYELGAAVQIRRSLQRICSGGILISAIYLLTYYVTTPTTFTETALFQFVPVLEIVSTTIFLSIWRSVYAIFLGVGHASQRVVIFGAGVTGAILAETFREHPHYQLVGFIDDDSQLVGKFRQDVPILGSRDSLLSTLDLRTVDQIVLAVSKPIDDDLLQLLTHCHERGIAITPMPVLYEKLTGKIAVEHIGSQWYAALPLTKHPFDSLNRVGKRLLDIACGLIIGAIFAIILPFVAIAIKLDSPGPIFYKQERVGLYGAKFTVCKFRSMVQNAERHGQAQWAVKNDARITKVGQFIRKTRLDELPQVINVLRGDMSMVGPRPERQQFIDELQQQLPFYRTRLAAKPGLTGWAQINYGYGSTVEDALIKLQYDLYYLKHWSPWLDIQILLRTFGVVFKMQGQ